MAESVRIPLHFPCAARVKMPQIGSEESDFALSRSKVSVSSNIEVQRAKSFELSDKNIFSLGNTYVKDISGGLSFEEDVVRDRCFHMLPYDKKYFWEAVDASNIIDIPQKQNIVVGRHNASGADMRHMPCMKGKPKLLKPLKKKVMNKAVRMHEEAKKARSKSQMSQTCESIADIEEDSNIDGVFMTEVSTESASATTKDENKTKPKVKKEMKEKKEESKPHFDKGKSVHKNIKALTGEVNTGSSSKENKNPNDWGAYLMSIISPMTAHWIVHHKMAGVTGGAGVSGKEELSQMLESWYGKPEHTDLIRDDMSETELQGETESKVQQPKKTWKKEEALLLDKVFKQRQEDLEKESENTSEVDETPFYRQPVGVRKQVKKEEKEEQGTINKTARDIKVKSYIPPPPPTMKDFFNAEAGKTLLETDNMFEREWLTGTQQIYQGPEEKEKIVMSSENIYHKKLQKEYPGTPDVWYPESTAEESKEDNSPTYSRPTRGAHRWKALPEPADDTKEKLRCLPPGTEPQVAVPSDAALKKITKQNPALSQIVDEWRSRWQLSGQFEDSTPDDLLKDMADIQPHVRLKAIATMAKAAQYKPPQEEGLQLEYQDPSKSSTNKLPDILFEGLNCLLQDKHDQVRKASAVTLFALDRPSDKAELIIRELLVSESLSDRWAAAQCLTHYGVCDSDIASEVIRQLLDTEDSIKHEQCIQLLAKLSASTTLIHSMVAEQLNSSSWRHRVIACKVFPTLDGSINRDVTNKLSHLMWKDWHIEVRKAAAQTLGKTGHGRDVHDELREKIQGDNERLKLEAISRVGHLGIMTAKLLPAILECFDDPYVSVRMEVCITCGNLLLKDELVINKILYLASFDTSWKVKALAIQAIGKIGLSSKRITDCLLWALRFEEEAGVRAEACHSLMLLGYSEDDYIEILQERLLVETSQVVRKEMSDALTKMGYSSNEEIDTVAQIKDEVRKLCDQSIIANQIISNDRDEEKERNLARMIYSSRQETQRLFSRTNNYIKMFTKAEIDRNIEYMNPSRFSQPSDDSPEKKDETSSTSAYKKSGTYSNDSVSPFNSREETNLTLGGDKELEVILSLPDPEGGSGSAPPTPGTSRSHPGTRGSSQASDGESESLAPDSQRPQGSAASIRSRMKRIPEEVDEADNKTDTDMKSEFDFNSQFDSKSELDDSRSFVTSDEKSTNQGASEKQNQTDDSSSGADTNSKLGKLSEKRASMKYDHQEIKSATPSYSELRSSALSVGRSSERRAILSRETLREREKINAEARKNLLTLNARYSSMIESLKEIDEGFCASLPNKEVKQEKLVSKLTLS